MTIIAYRHPYIVADQRVGNTNAMILGSMDKLRVHKSENKTVYMGAAGDAGHVDNLFEYVLHDLAIVKNEERAKELRELLVPDPKGEGKMDGLVVEVTDGVAVYHCYDDDLSRITFKHDFYAEGSGMRIALGAMQMGADAFEAVDAVTQLDMSCGYPVSGYNVLTGQSYFFVSRNQLMARKSAEQFILI